MGKKIDRKKLFKRENTGNNRLLIKNQEYCEKMIKNERYWDS